MIIVVPIAEVPLIQDDLNAVLDQEACQAMPHCLRASQLCEYEIKTRFWSAISSDRHQRQISSRTRRLAGAMMAELIAACERGHDHHRDPLPFHLRAPDARLARLLLAPARNQPGEQLLVAGLTRAGGVGLRVLSLVETALATGRREPRLSCLS